MKAAVNAAIRPSRPPARRPAAIFSADRWPPPRIGKLAPRFLLVDVDTRCCCSALALADKFKKRIAARLALPTNLKGKLLVLVLNDTQLLRQACYVGGAWVGADGGETVTVTNPTTTRARPVAGVPRCGYAETERAIVAATTRIKTWRQTAASATASCAAGST